MGKDILGNPQLKVALLSPGDGRSTAIAHFQTAFARVMSRVVHMDYVTETPGEYNGITFIPMSNFAPGEYDVLHFQWGNNPLHLFEFSTLLTLNPSKERPLIVSTLHEADLGYLVGASSEAWHYRWWFKLRGGRRKVARKMGSDTDRQRLADYDFFSHSTVAAILSRSDRIVVNSQYAKRLLVADHHLNDEMAARIKVARLGIDWDDYAHLRETRPGFWDLEPITVFLYVGSLHPTKSVDKLIRALHLVKSFANRDDFFLVVVGHGPESDNLHRLAEALIPNRYHFAGLVPSVLPYYEVSDVVVCPRAFCRGEISGSIPEACAAGKPVILPNVGGWAEYVNESRGFLVRRDHELEYADAILDCLEHSELVTQKGENARRFAHQSLSWQSQTHFFLSMYALSKTTDKDHSLRSTSVVRSGALQKIPEDLTFAGGNIDEDLLATIHDYLAHSIVTPEAKTELLEYLKEALPRITLTMYLVPAQPGKLLELGANPYFFTLLLKNSRDYELELANFHSERQPYDPTQIHRQEVRNEKYGENHTFNYRIFNIEKDVFPYPDDTFDLVLFCEILEHLTTDPLFAFRQIHRVLKQRGTLIVTTPNVARRENVGKLLAGKNIYDPYSGYGVYGRHNREYTPNELAELFPRMGFEIEKLCTIDVRADVEPLPGKLPFSNPPEMQGQYILLRAFKSGPFSFHYPDYPDWLYRSLVWSD